MGTQCECWERKTLRDNWKPWTRRKKIPHRQTYTVLVTNESTVIDTLFKLTVRRVCTWKSTMDIKWVIVDFTIRLHWWTLSLGPISTQTTYYYSQNWKCEWRKSCNVIKKNWHLEKLAIKSGITEIEWEIRQNKTPEI